MRRLFAAAALVAVAACSQDRMFDPADEQALVAAALARLEANRLCSADPRIAPLMEGQGPLGACIARAHATAYKDLSASRAPGDKNAAYDVKTWIAKHPPSVDAWRSECDAVVIAALANERPACTPYQVGVRSLPDLSLLSELELAQLVADQVQRLAAAGRGTEAVALAGNAAVLFESAARGHTTLPGTMIADGSLLKLADGIDATIDALPAADRAALVHAVDRALAAMPPVLDTLVGETQWLDLHYGVVPLMPAGWPISGGDDHLIRAPQLAGYGAPHEEAVVRLLAGERLRADLERACPAEGSIATCFHALPPRSDAAHFSAVVDERRLLYIAAVAFGDLGIREELVKLTADTGGMLTHYVGRVGYLVARLGALRLHAAGTCTAGAVPLAPLGEPLEVTRAGDRVTVTAPRWVVVNGGPRTWSFACR